MKRAAVAMAALVLAGYGCGAPPRARTTFLGSVDLVNMTDRMAESFAADPVLSRRTPDDDRWIVSVYRVSNFTNQIIPDREKWLYTARLRALLARSDVGERYGMVWIIPPERWPIVAEELGIADEPYGLRLDPTHVLSAEFHALTQTSGDGRSDHYLCSFQLMELAYGRLVWEDAWEVKRAVTGVTYD